MLYPRGRSSTAPSRSIRTEPPAGYSEGGSTRSVNQPAAIEGFDWALRLSPFDPFGCLSAAGMAFAHLAARRFEEAIEWADRALHEQPRFIVAIRAKIVANAYLGRLDEARADLGRMPAIDSKLTIAEWRAFATPLFAPEFLELYVTGMRLAGLPEE